MSSSFDGYWEYFIEDLEIRLVASRVLAGKVVDFSVATRTIHPNSSVAKFSITTPITVTVLITITLRNRNCNFCNTA